MNDNSGLVNYINNYKSNDYDSKANPNETSLNIARNIKKSNTRVKPKFFKLLGQVMNLHVEVNFIVN